MTNFVSPSFSPLCRLLMTAALATFCASAQAAAFTPKLGQAGKDVMWLPTPDALVTRLLQMAQLRSTDRLVDLGAGDGKIVIAAARDFGATARGVEFDARLVDVARAEAVRAGVGDRTSFVQGDIFKTDYSDAGVVAMYLLPQLNLKLRPTLLAMKPGTRIVTHWFDMGQWKPDETTEVENRPGYLWIVPANVHGTWRIEGGASAAELTLTQRFQDIEGVLELGNVQTSLRQPLLSGASLQYGFTDLQGHRQVVRAIIDGDVMRGEITQQGLGPHIPALTLSPDTATLRSGPSGQAGYVSDSVPASSGKKQPFVARRVHKAGPLPGSEEPSEAELNAAAASLGTE